VQSNWEYLNDFLTDACLFCDGHPRSVEEIESIKEAVNSTVKSVSDYS